MYSLFKAPIHYEVSLALLSRRLLRMLRQTEELVALNLAAWGLSLYLQFAFSIWVFK